MVLGCLSVLTVILVLSLVGCSDRVSRLDELQSTAQHLLDKLTTDVEDGPEVTESKSVRYITATGLVSGAENEIRDLVADQLVDDGWKITTSEPLDVQQTPATWGQQVIAERRGIVARLLLYDRIGDREAPTSRAWLQLSVATPSDNLSWTQSVVTSP